MKKIALILAVLLLIGITGIAIKSPFQVLYPSPTQPPKSPQIPLPQILLTISSPANGTIVSSSSLTIKGKTAPKAEVFINETETVADSAGNFSATITLDEGENIISIFANDEGGNFAEQELAVNYSLPE